MNAWSKVCKKTGRIDCVLFCQNQPIVSNDFYLINESIDDATFYIENGAKKTRPLLQLSDVLQYKEFLIFQNIPIGTKLFFDNLSFVIDDSTLELNLPINKNYEVFFDPPFPWVSQKLQILKNENIN